MSEPSILDLTFRGNKLVQSADEIGELRRSDDAADDREELHRRLDEDGYLFVPGALDHDEVMDARLEVLRRLDGAGFVDSVNHPLIEGHYKEGGQMGGYGFLTEDNAPLHKVLYSGRMMQFHEFFQGGPIRHYDHTWYRVKTPGPGGPTTPHYDVVYMGRGTKKLLTSWTPMGDCSYDMGGLIVLEGSHKLEALKNSYGSTDVDAYCENTSAPDAKEIIEGAKAEGRGLNAEERHKIEWNSTGAYSSDAIEVKNELGGRWLSAEFKAGDLLVFCIYLMHGSADNRSSLLRLSTDSRYQLASEPIDDRWIGEEPYGHGIEGKKGMIC
jgi:hypothetical protein